MISSPGSKRAARIAVILLALAIIALVSVHSTLEVGRDAGSLEHTHKVLAANKTALNVIRSDATSVRGFLLTGDEQFLKNHLLAPAKSQEALNKLKLLVADNPGQQKLLATLTTLIPERLAISQATVQKRRDGGIAAAQQFALASRGELLLEGIRQATAELEKGELKCLELRALNAQASAQEILAATILGGILTILFVGGALGIVRGDLRKRLLAEKKFRQIVEFAPDAMLIFDQDGKVELANVRAERLFGYVREELIGLSIKSLVPNCTFSLPNPIEDGFPDLVASRAAEQELLAHHQNGATFPVEISLSPLASDDGLLISAAVRDITARKQMERALQESHESLENRVRERTADLAELNRALLVEIGERTRAGQALSESEQRFRQLVENIDEVFWMHDAKSGELLFISPGYEKIWGRTCASLYACQTTWLDAVYPKDHLRVTEAVAKRPSSGPQDLEYRIVRPDGTIRWIRDRSFPVANAEGEVLRITGIADDITAQKLAEEAVRVRGREHQALAQLGKHALEGRSLNRLLDEVVESVPQVLNVEFSMMLETREDDQLLLLRAGKGWSKGSVGKATFGCGDQSHPGFSLQSNMPIIVEDLREDRRFGASPLLLEHGARSGVCVIVQARGKARGVLAAYSSKLRLFTAAEIHFLQSTANLVGAVIERATLEQALLEISEREQRRIGQDLHDSLCQHLAGLQFMTSALALRIEDPKLKAEATRISSLMIAGVEQGRLLAHGLVPLHLETDGLTSALSELTCGISSIFRINCRFECPRPVHIEDLAAATHLYRIAQESISNAIKHGRANSVVVTLSTSGGKGTLEIIDDGIGFEPNTTSSTGLGLRTIECRAGMIGAAISIASTVGKGTTLTCLFDRRALASRHAGLPASGADFQVGSFFSPHAGEIEESSDLEAGPTL